MVCYDSDHFKLVNGVLTPQAWMQWRQVATATAASKEGTYPASGGVAKNDVLQTVTATWLNNTPIAQWVYGMVTRGGCRVSLQARSRAYLKMSHAGAISSSAGAFAEVSRVGTGAQVGTAGLFAANAYGIPEIRQPSITLPLKPQTAGWVKLNPSQRYTAAVELRFVSDFWENNIIDGGNTQTDSSYVTGVTQIDLFAIPVI